MEKQIIHQSGVDVLSAIENRRSIRAYTEEPVTDGQLATLLNAGFCAPSAHNRQPWEFVVVRDRAMLESFSAHAKYQKMVEHSALSIVVCGDTEKMHTHDLLMNDCAAAVENMLLAAHGLGLGAVWCGIVQDDLVRFFSKSLCLPAHVLPVALIAVGHPAEERPAPNRFRPQQVHFEMFGGQE